MAARTVLVAVLALTIGLAASSLVARRQRTSGDPEWTRARSQLTARERRAVAVAVRQGRPVDDPRLRPAASAMARMLVERVERLERPSRWRWWFWVLLAVTTIAAAVGMVVDDHPWRNAVTIAVNVVFAAGLWAARRISGGVAAQARAALVANEP